MRFFSSTLAGLAILTVALFGALVFLVTTGFSSGEGGGEAVLNGPLGIAESDDGVATFAPVQEFEPDALLPGVWQSAWFIAEGHVKVLAVSDTRDFSDDRFLLLDEARRRVFEKSSVHLIPSESATIEELEGRSADAASADEKLVVVGPVFNVNGRDVREVIHLTEVEPVS